MECIRKGRWQKVLTEERQHLPDFYVAALEPPQLSREATGLAAHELFAGAFTPQATDGRPESKSAARSDTRQRHSETTTDASAPDACSITHAGYYGRSAREDWRPGKVLQGHGHGRALQGAA